MVSGHWIFFFSHLDDASIFVPPPVSLFQNLLHFLKRLPLSKGF
jgi:hypothetical protein